MIAVQEIVEIAVKRVQNFVIECEQFTSSLQAKRAKENEMS